MSDCTRLSDRMPDVVRGLTRWTDADECHLQECHSCGAEWAVVRATATLGESVSVDAGEVAAAVASGLARRPQPVSVRRRFLPWLVPMAAAAALAVTFGVSQLRPPAPEPPSPEFSLLPELETLSATELETMLGLLPEQGELPDVRSFEELSEDELTAVLEELEG